MNVIQWEFVEMFDRRFLRTKLGQAAVASVMAMTALVALSSQLQATPAHAAEAPVSAVVLA
ncbi:hypothetical protein [Tsuneonella mangrovi]|uniref:hypothetical protein n=1 Tax=Tsuneonella mangrovi TaxID=1982042 RepID=UPI0012372A58|nr:hypothetical protein [Tsuneonella mangrovi]